MDKNSGYITNDNLTFTPIIPIHFNPEYQKKSCKECVFCCITDRLICTLSPPKVIVDYEEGGITTVYPHLSDINYTPCSRFLQK